MASNDDFDAQMRKMISESGALKEALSLDGMLQISRSLGDAAAANKLGWWAIYKKDKDGTVNWIFGS